MQIIVRPRSGPGGAVRLPAWRRIPARCDFPDRRDRDRGPAAHAKVGTFARARARSRLKRGYVENSLRGNSHSACAPRSVMRMVSLMEMPQSAIQIPGMKCSSCPASPSNPPSGDDSGTDPPHAINGSGTPTPYWRCRRGCWTSYSRTRRPLPSWRPIRGSSSSSC